MCFGYSFPVPPTQFETRVTDCRELSGGYFVLTLQAGFAPGLSPLRDVTPGQFVMLRGNWGRDLLNPRAFSVLDADADGRLQVMLKVYGRGTAKLRAAQPGECVTVTGPLGRGFPAPVPGVKQLLVAGGVGLPPLYLQAQRTVDSERTEKLEFFYGGRTSDDLVMTDSIERWGIPLVLATEDGSRGKQGYVTLPLEERLQDARRAGERIQVLSCGPTPMLRRVRELGLKYGVSTKLCLEEEMACGFGVCLGCAVPVYGAKPYRYCCSDGPVFDAKEVRWS